MCTWAFIEDSSQGGENIWRGAGLKPFQYLEQQGIRLAYYEVLMIVPQVW